MVVSASCLALVPAIWTGLSPSLAGVPLTLGCVVGLMIWATVFMGQRHFGWAAQLDAWLSSRVPVRPLVAVLVGGAVWGTVDAVAEHESLQAYVPADPALRLGVALVLIAALGRGMMRPARLRDAGAGSSLALALGVAWPLGGAWILAAATLSAWAVNTVAAGPASLIVGSTVLLAGAVLAYRPKALRAELASADPSPADLNRLVRRARLHSGLGLGLLWLVVQPFADEPATAGLLALAALWASASVADLFRGAAGSGEHAPATPTAALLVAARREGRVAQGAIGTILGNMRTAGSVTNSSQ